MTTNYKVSKRANMMSVPGILFEKTDMFICSWNVDTVIRNFIGDSPLHKSYVHPYIVVLWLIIDDIGQGCNCDSFSLRHNTYAHIWHHQSTNSYHINYLNCLSVCYIHVRKWNNNIHREETITVLVVNNNSYFNKNV